MELHIAELEEGLLVLLKTTFLVQVEILEVLELELNKLSYLFGQHIDKLLETMDQFPKNGNCHILHDNF